MRFATRHFALLLVLAFVASLPVQIAAQQAPARPHGELITPVAPVAPKPAPAPGAKGTVRTETTKTTPAQAEAPKTGAAPGQAAPDYAPIGFDTLASYNFEVDDTPLTNAAAGADKANNQIPARVKAFDKRKVSIRGFMLPLAVSNGVVTEFLIMKDQSMCCYGSVPKINEWVNVKTPGHGVKSIMDQPVSIEGTLHVGAMRENGYLIGIYRMDGDKLIAPQN